MTLPIKSQIPGRPCFGDQQFFILQPLFRALTIIILEDDFNVFISDIGKLPALLTLTGQDHGLSQPLSFDSISHYYIDKFVSKTAIQVPLGVAIDFVLAQQEREIAFFGQRPDPVESTRGLRNGLNLSPRGIDSFMRQLGWNGKAIEGPSSAWVDTEIYREWTGVGAIDDKRLCQLSEDCERFRMLCKVAGVNHNSGVPRRRHSI
ncbi:hypothetical protein F66182_10989 [Fusarium sp. NRRL 66182]|nr:hypothetical protein F66182_10989 [Fusarium sp. NRRL 66182]